MWTEVDRDKENHRIQYALADKANGTLIKRAFTNGQFDLKYSDDYGESDYGDNLRVHTAVVDYNADGRMDIIIHSEQTGRTKVYLSTPQDSGGWRLDSAGIDLMFKGRYRYADLNADGLQDAYKLVPLCGKEVCEEGAHVPTGYHLEMRLPETGLGPDCDIGSLLCVR